MGRKIQNDVLGRSEVAYAIRDMIQGYVLGIETCMPATIVDVDSEMFGIVKCQPLVMLTYEEDGEFKQEKRSEVTCKFWTPNLGSDSVFMPIKPKPGMTGWIIGGARDSFLSIVGNNASKWGGNLGPRKSLSREANRYQYGLFLPDTFFNNRHLEVEGTDHGLKLVKVPESASSAIPDDGEDGINLDSYDESTHASWNLDGENTEVSIETGDDEGSSDASVKLKHLSNGDTKEISMSTADLDGDETAKIQQCYVITDVGGSSITVCKAKVLAYIDVDSAQTLKIG